MYSFNITKKQKNELSSKLNSVTFYLLYYFRNFKLSISNFFTRLKSDKF